MMSLSIRSLGSMAVILSIPFLITLGASNSKLGGYYAICWRDDKHGPRCAVIRIREEQLARLHPTLASRDISLNRRFCQGKKRGTVFVARDRGHERARGGEKPRS